LDDVSVARVITRIETLLPIGVRQRQLSVRTLWLGILLCIADDRPAHLIRVHQALLALGDADRWRLGVYMRYKRGRHLLTYRQVERTARLVFEALSKPHPDGTPSELLSEFSDSLLEASVGEEYKHQSSSYACDWSDVCSFSSPPLSAGGPCADPEASWGHRNANNPGTRHELFFGYFFQVATMVADEDGGDVAELVRRMLVTSCHVDPPHAFIFVLVRMSESGIVIADVICDSGYAHRVPEHWAAPLRLIGASLVMDLHPSDRGPKGTYGGAVIFNGAFYCPSTPKALFDLGPLARDASKDQIRAHDQLTTELDRYRLGRISKEDSDGYQRVMCPAVLGKCRCPLRPESLTLSHERPEVLDPPEHPPVCCTQKTLTVGPEVAAKTAQKHPYPSKAHRYSYARRTAAERTNATIKDPARTDVSRGWCRLMGLAPITVFIACALVVRNMRVIDSFEVRREDDERRMAAGREPKTRRRRRRTLSDLVGASATPP
jgi:hypothetical protein